MKVLPFYSFFWGMQEKKDLFSSPLDDIMAGFFKSLCHEFRYEARYKQGSEP